MYLVDTDVISEARKGERANSGVRIFFDGATAHRLPLFISAVTIGELRQAVETTRFRGAVVQARLLERWLGRITADYGDAILPVDAEIAQIWGRLRVPHPENPLDKQIAATALIYNLTIVTRNWSHYNRTGAKVLNPFN